MNELQTSRRRCFDLFLISCTVLFIELAAIRWFPAYVISLTFFTNFVLLAAFVGMSVGCLAAERRWSVLDYLPSLMAVTCAAAVAVYISMGYMWLATVEVGDSKSPELVYFGTERVGQAAEKQAIPVEIVLSTFFVLIALWFVGLGQVLGRKLAAVENRILAYTVNIAGSLAGIVVFAAFSQFELPPICWFAAGIACLLYFLRETKQVTVANLTLVAGTLVLIGILGWRLPGYRFYWSPYYAIRYSPKDREITTNGLSHQRMLPTQGTPAYALPYLLRREAGLPPAKDVLVIGAGSGNDVAHALANGVEHVDAVEIDPVIARLGKQDHPDRPYSDGRVRQVINDGRAFLRSSDRQYDLIVYALVDSLTLHSSFSSIRLENFLFTQEAIHEVRKRLKPGGVFVAYNFYRQGWIVARLNLMMREAFGTEPMIFSLPPRAEIRDIESEGTHMAVLLGGTPEALAPYRARLENSRGILFTSNTVSDATYNAVALYVDSASFPERSVEFHGSSGGAHGSSGEAHESPGGPHDSAGEFHGASMETRWRGEGVNAPSAEARKSLEGIHAGGTELAMPVLPSDDDSRTAASSGEPDGPEPIRLLPARLIETQTWRVPTDDWPFLYLREARIPAHNWRGLAILLALSLGLLLVFSPKRSWRLNPHFFFLGAGFMLIETKSVTQMAQLFGSSWQVNSIVFAGILLMILLSNLFVLRLRPERLLPYYIGLGLALALCWSVPMSQFIGHSLPLRIVESIGVLFLPIFFAGIIFSTSFSRCGDPALAFGANIAGVVLGGLLEYLSLVIGYQGLLLVAAGLYVLSVWGLNRFAGVPRVG